jgi:hypothetical protein
MLEEKVAEELKIVWLFHNLTPPKSLANWTYAPSGSM